MLSGAAILIIYIIQETLLRDLGKRAGHVVLLLINSRPHLRRT
jgi:hypothetical protein